MIYKEILKLKEMLSKANIPFTFDDLCGGYHLSYPTNDEENRICSVIEHDYSYGRKKDLLEIMGLLTDKELTRDDVAGGLTAKDVFNRISNDWRKKQTLKDNKGETEND